MTVETARTLWKAAAVAVFMLIATTKASAQGGIGRGPCDGATGPSI